MLGGVVVSTGAAQQVINFGRTDMVKGMRGSFCLLGTEIKRSDLRRQKNERSARTKENHQASSFSLGMEERAYQAKK